jgi:hypothetical protein
VAALAEALRLAAEAGQWPIVEQLARQLAILQGKDDLRALPGSPVSLERGDT